MGGISLKFAPLSSRSRRRLPLVGWAVILFLISAWGSKAIRAKPFFEAKPALVSALPWNQSSSIQAPSKWIRAASPGRDEAWTEMVDELTTTALGHPGQVGIVIRDLQTGKEWSHHADDLFPSASLIKIPILAAILNRIRERSLRLDTKLTLRRRLRMGGSGSIKWHRDGTVFSVRELLERMIADSDNTATKMLISYVGYYYLQRQFEKLGMVYTEIHPEGMKLQSGRVPKENYTTAREMADLLERIYRKEVIDEFSSEFMLELMRKIKRKTRLAANIPPGWKLAHKTGTLRRACHDAGIFFTPTGDYLVVVLTGRNRSYRSAKRFIAKVADQTHPYFRRGQVEMASIK